MRRFHWLAVAAALAVSGCGDQAEDEGAVGVAADAARDVVDAAAPPDLQFCEALQRRVTPADCDDATALSDRAAEGVAAVNWPASMMQDRAYAIRLAIGQAQAPIPAVPAATPDPPADASATPDEAGDAPASPPDAGRGPAADPAAPAPRPTPQAAVEALEGETVEYAPLVGRFMSAELSGPAFKIAAKSPREQEVLADSVTVWDWEVTPTRPGTHPLTITTSVDFVDARGQRLPLRRTVETKTLEVKVSFVSMAARVFRDLPGWLKGLAAILGGATGVVGAWYALRKALKGPGAPAAPG